MASRKEVSPYRFFFSHWLVQPGTLTCVQVVANMQILMTHLLHTDNTWYSELLHFTLSPGKTNLSKRQNRACNDKLWWCRDPCPRVCVYPEGEEARVWPLHLCGYGAPVWVIDGAWQSRTFLIPHNNDATLHGLSYSVPVDSSIFTFIIFQNSASLLHSAWLRRWNTDILFVARFVALIAGF